MPNHVVNKIVFANKTDYEAVLGRCRKESKSNGYFFDFNTLIPMPKSLEIDSGTATDMAVYAYCILNDVRGQDIPLRDYTIAIYRERVGITKSAVQKWAEDNEVNVYGVGKTAYENKIKYGATTWYDWAISNWGTKWNAYNCEFKDQEHTVIFQTAWSFPEPVAIALYGAFPNADFSWHWADEDTGCNTGLMDASDGGYVINKYDNESTEAYNTYVECWGESDCIGRRDDGSYFRYSCDDCPNPC